MREKQKRRREKGGGNLSFENREVEKEKIKEQQERRQLQSVFCFHKNDYSSQVTQFCRALRKTVRNTIIKTQ